MAERALAYTERWQRGTGALPDNSAASQRSALAGSRWEPTTVNLIVLVIVEMAVYAALRYAFRAFHGG